MTPATMLVKTVIMGCTETFATMGTNGLMMSVPTDATRQTQNAPSNDPSPRRGPLAYCTNIVLAFVHTERWIVARDRTTAWPQPCLLEDAG